MRYYLPYILFLNMFLSCQQTEWDFDKMGSLINFHVPIMNEHFFFKDLIGTTSGLQSTNESVLLSLDTLTFKVSDFFSLKIPEYREIIPTSSNVLPSFDTVVLKIPIPWDLDTITPMPGSYIDFKVSSGVTLFITDQTWNKDFERMDYDGTQYILSNGNKEIELTAYFKSNSSIIDLSVDFSHLSIYKATGRLGTTSLDTTLTIKMNAIAPTILPTTVSLKTETINSMGISFATNIEVKNVVETILIKNTISPATDADPFITDIMKNDISTLLKPEMPDEIQQYVQVIGNEEEDSYNIIYHNSELSVMSSIVIDSMNFQHHTMQFSIDNEKIFNEPQQLHIQVDNKMPFDIEVYSYFFDKNGDSVAMCNEQTAISSKTISSELKLNTEDGIKHKAKGITYKIISNGHFAVKDAINKSVLIHMNGLFEPF